jgi:uncharacterized membrane protein YidH (DUF202 family)
MTHSAHNLARRAGNNPVLEAGARLGYAASGVLHLVLAWLALQLAFGGNGGQADQSGALRELARTPVGAALLWVLLVGFVLLGLWQLTEVFARPGSKKVSPAAKMVVYAVLAVSTISVLNGASASSNQQTESATATAMSTPAGVWAVAGVGVLVIGVGIFHVVKAVRRGFLKDLGGHPPQWVVRVGQAGYVAKGIALGAVGVLFVIAATTHDPNKAGGLDAGLRSLLSVPAGAVVLAAVAVGLACYGVYSFARARYARV